MMTFICLCEYHYGGDIIKMMVLSKYDMMTFICLYKYHCYGDIIAHIMMITKCEYADDVYDKV